MKHNSHMINCPWCKTQYQEITVTNCNNCGGTLEYSINTSSAGPKPQHAPRVLPQKYIRRVKYTGNVYTLIGMVFTIPFFWTIIFPIIGYFLWKKGIKVANEELIPLEHGDSIAGEIESISRDYSIKINGVSPFVIHFIFEVNGQKHRGSVGNIFDDIDLKKKVGDLIWVVYMKNNPELSSIWPPLK